MHIGKWDISIKDLIWFIVCLVLVLCFFTGIFLYDKACASAVLSGASTAILIVLSIVAILYTMIEGAASSQINQDSKNKLESIDLQLHDVTERLVELKDIERRIKYVGPKLDAIVQEIERSSQQSTDIFIDDDVKKNISYLMHYINEDIDD